MLCGCSGRADLKGIEEDIKTMPDYFADYNTIVHFVSQEELDKIMLVYLMVVL